jgi:hypothetical protein
MQLKKAVTNDRSAPQLGKATGSVAPAPTGAPPIPGIARPPTGLAPPIPGHRARSNSDTGSGGDTASLPQAPQLGGIFAGGMPKLKKRGGGVDTGGKL